MEKSVMRRRPHGFTLIEVLIVISIIVLLVGMLIPAILKAESTVNKMMTRQQIKNLGDACNAYFATFNQQYPGLIADPPAAPSTGATPANISGAQVLRLCLMGCQLAEWEQNWANRRYVPMYQGPADDIRHYGNPALTRMRSAFYTPKREEIVRHSAVLMKSGSLDTGYVVTDPNIDIEVFVDYRLTPPRPLLYYRKLPNYVTDPTDGTVYFRYESNGVYCGGDPLENKANFRSIYVTATGLPSRSARAMSQGFVIVSAGEDRKFFRTTDNDDLDNLGN